MRDRENRRARTQTPPRALQHITPPLCHSHLAHTLGRGRTMPEAIMKTVRSMMLDCDQMYMYARMRRSSSVKTRKGAEAGERKGGSDSQRPVERHPSKAL